MIGLRVQLARTVQQDLLLPHSMPTTCAWKPCKQQRHGALPVIHTSMCCKSAPSACHYQAEVGHCAQLAMPLHRKACAVMRQHNVQSTCNNMRTRLKLHAQSEKQMKCSAALQVNVEDTKAGRLERGTLTITNARVLWCSSQSSHINLGVGIQTITKFDMTSKARSGAFLPQPPASKSSFMC